MKVESWDPDLQSLLTRYHGETLDLQPSFQRGLVWNDEKKARLIDTVLRGWRIPPVHYLVEGDERLSILDGQQRLQALFDFVDGRWPLRSFPPFDDEIAGLEGLTFSRLPDLYQRRILSSRISGYRLYDYQPSEPYELFFRLNLPTGLTQAEKRNALTGPAREQVKNLVRAGARMGWGKDLLGFSDGRLAYDDVVARFCMYLRAGTLRQFLAPSDMELAYRDTVGFTDEVFRWAERSVERFTFTLKNLSTPVRLNKATMLTWLVVAARSFAGDPGLNLGSALERLETARTRIGRKDPADLFNQFEDPIRFGPLIAVYANRSSLRVADVLSVQARDAVAWLAIAESNPQRSLPPAIRDMDRELGQLPFLGPDQFEEELLSRVSKNLVWSSLA